MDINPKLTEEQKKVVVEKGTEAPYSGKFLNHKENGMYTCVNCGAELFSSESKYDSETPGLIGWPSFSEAAESSALKYIDDDTMGMRRTEAICANCGAHLGHVFEADDSPTGQHFCINSVSLDFKPNANK
jgi:peptide-methionine (R)-S-oxide reductase